MENYPHVIPNTLIHMLFFPVLLYFHFANKLSSKFFIYAQRSKGCLIVTKLPELFPPLGLLRVLIRQAINFKKNQDGYTQTLLFGLQRNF